MNILGIYGAFNWNANIHARTAPKQIAKQGWINYQAGALDDTWLHDAGACLVKNGFLTCAILEERLTRIKHEGNFPRLSINYCLESAGLSHEEIDIVTVVSTGAIDFFKAESEGIIEFFLKQLFPRAKVLVYDHHASHSASSVFTSKFIKGNTLSLDGVGACVYGHTPERVLDRFGGQHAGAGLFNLNEGMIRHYNASIGTDTNVFGNFYGGMAGYIYVNKMRELNPNMEFDSWLIRETAPGKVMGLGAYADPNYYYDFNWQNMPLHDIQLEGHLVPPNVHFYQDYDIANTPESNAAYLQYVWTHYMLRYLKALTDNGYAGGNMCFSGGCFLNVLTNTEIRKLPFIDNMHIPPYTSDSGLAIGAALLACYKHDCIPSIPNNIALLGKLYTDSDFLDALYEYRIQDFVRYDNLNQLCTDVAVDLNNNKIIGWFQNKSESGPRALGSRSILMHPGPAENKDILNSKVKHREYWRPFAGAIISEYKNEYFNEDFESPYMLYSFSTKPEVRDKIAAINHKDNTCRAQTVSVDMYPELYELLLAFKQVSGIPILLNTSFNDSGEPLIESPKDAIKAFLNQNIDVLVLGNYVIKK